VAAKAVHDLIHHLRLHDRPKILVGFSQGGFFIPHLLRELKNVKHLLTMGCAYRPEDYPGGKKFKLDAIHGDEDEIVPFKIAEDSFKILTKQHVEGTFTSMKGMGHTLNDEARKWLHQKVTELRSP
jgi:predicted esterase